MDNSSSHSTRARLLRRRLASLLGLAHILDKRALMEIRASNRIVRSHTARRLTTNRNMVNNRDRQADTATFVINLNSPSFNDVGSTLNDMLTISLQGQQQQPPGQQQYGAPPSQQYGAPGKRMTGGRIV